MTPAQQALLARLRDHARELLPVARQRVAQRLHTLMGGNDNRLLEVWNIISPTNQEFASILLQQDGSHFVAAVYWLRFWFCGFMIRTYVMALMLLNLEAVTTLKCGCCGRMSGGTQHTYSSVDGTPSIDGSQSPRYDGLNITPQPSDLHEEEDGFAFGAAYLQLKPCHMCSFTFCSGNSGLIAQGNVDAPFATIDTFAVLLQELGDEDLRDCMDAVMAFRPLSVLFEAQIHSEMLLADAEAIYLPQAYKAPSTHTLRSRFARAHELADRYDRQVRFCS